MELLEKEISISGYGLTERLAKDELYQNINRHLGIFYNNFKIKCKRDLGEDSIIIKRKGKNNGKYNKRYFIKATRYYDDEFGEILKLEIVVNFNEFITECEKNIYQKIFQLEKENNELRTIIEEMKKNMKPFSDNCGIFKKCHEFIVLRH